MEAGTQIKKYRSNMGISQEELAEKVYVSRQTISNWETGKNYPDIHSVLLLSSVFNVSLDQLIKGDVEIMKKKEINETEIKKLNHYGSIYTAFLILAIISFIPFIALIGWYGLIPRSAVITFIIIFLMAKLFCREQHCLAQEPRGTHHCRRAGARLPTCLSGICFR